jgi:cobyrinic acid a,c-diamide synthase
MPHEQDAVQSNTDSDSGNNTNSRSAPAATSPAQQQEQQAAATGMPAYLTKLAQHASKHVDMTLLLHMAADVVPPDQQEAAAAAAEAEAQHQQLQAGHGSQPAVQLAQQAVMDGRAEHALPLTKVPGPSCRIAVARDDAFCFYYQVIPAVM